MNGNNGKSNDGPKHQPKSNFGVVKNQGRKGFANESLNLSRTRSNAITDAPERSRASAISDTPTRSRANAVFGAPEGFGKIKNEGRQNKQPGNSNSFGIKDQLQNLGRAAFTKNPDRENMSFGQKTGFNLMSGFMDKLIGEAEKPNPGETPQRPGFLQPPGNTGFNPNGENDNRRMNMQAQPSNNNDDNITAGEFFKRLQTAMQDPAKFKREAQQKQQERATQQNHQMQEQQQQRQHSGAPQQQQPTAQDFFKELRGALKDPAGYKRRVEAQQRQQQNKQLPGQATQGEEHLPKTNPSTGSKQPPKPNPDSKPKPIKKSPRK